MKSKKQIYMQEQKKHPMQFGAYALPEQWQLDAMELYADQFKTKICPCQQQEAELKEIKRINQASGNKL